MYYYKDDDNYNEGDKNSTFYANFLELAITVKK